MATATMAMIEPAQLPVIPLRAVEKRPIFTYPHQPPPSPRDYFKDPFEPSRHLVNSPMPERHTMKELGLECQGVSDYAVSEPFRLFTTEATKAMRDEVLTDEVWKHCRYASSIAPCQLRGMAPNFAKFVYDAWTNPVTLNKISEIAGVTLVPVMDYEIGHINVSFTKEGDEVSTPVVNWHKDSYPFVCVLMLSDARKMIGGETAVMQSNGEIRKVRGPQMGSAVVLQGRYINHQALPATNCGERITMVTSFRPKDPELPDDSHLLTVRPVSDLNELYFQWSEYRVEIIEERCRRLVKRVREQKRVGRDFDVKTVRSYLETMMGFLEATAKEIDDMDQYQIKDELKLDAKKRVKEAKIGKRKRVKKEKE